MLKFSKVREVKTPNRGTPGSAGIDFYVPTDFNDGNAFLLHPGKDILIPSGIHCNIPEGFALLGVDKSGIATRKQLTLLAKLIDEDYEGEIHIHLMNVGEYTQEILPDMKIAQFVLLPVDSRLPVEVSFEELYLNSTSERGTGGFGSTN